MFSLLGVERMLETITGAVGSAEQPLQMRESRVINVSNKKPSLRSKRKTFRTRLILNPDPQIKPSHQTAIKSKTIPKKLNPPTYISYRQEGI